VLGTSTRTSDVLINLGLNPLRRLREVGSPQFGVLSARAPPSPRCTALTAASCENHGAAPNFGTRVPGIFGGKQQKPVPLGGISKRISIYCRIDNYTAIFLDINQSFGQINPKRVGPSGIGHA
jgi:hypothetical protein